MSIKSDIKKYWPLLMANGVYYLCTGLSEAVIGKEVYAILSPRLISLQSIIGWGGGIVLGLAWSKWNKKMFPLLIPMFLMQIIASVLYFIYAEATLNMFIFWFLGLGMYIFFGGLADKIFDGAVSCVAGFSGYVLSMIYVPSLRMAIFFSFLATFFWCFGVLIYSFANKNKLKDDDFSERKIDVGTQNNS